MAIRVLVLTVAVLWLGATGVGAGDGDKPQRIDGDKAEQLATLCDAALAKLVNPPPVKTALDLKRGMGLGARKVFVLLVPDTRLKAKALEKLDKEILPLGVLLAHRVTPVVGDFGLGAEEHRKVEIMVGDQPLTVTAMYLAVAKVGGRLVLLVYTGADTPTVVAALTEVEAKQEQPLELTVSPLGRDRTSLLINVLGRYQAAVHVAGHE